jgi:hypothetical protein
MQERCVRTAIYQRIAEVTEQIVQLEKRGSNDICQNKLGKKALFTSQPKRSRKKKEKEKTHTAPIPKAKAATPQAKDLFLGSSVN